MNELKKSADQESERWGAYRDGDETVHCHDSEAEACDAVECYLDDVSEPGEEVEYLLAPMIPAKELLKRENPVSIGESILEDIDCRLADEMGAEEEVLSLTKEDIRGLGNLVLEFLLARAQANWWTVDTTREQKRTYIVGSNEAREQNQQQ